MAVQDFLVDGLGRHGRPYRAGYLLVPREIQLDGDRLVWRLPTGRPRGAKEAVAAVRTFRSDPDAISRAFGVPRFVSPPRDLLRRFIKLAEASSESIERFARSYGVLGICEHGLPASHDPEHFGRTGWQGCWPSRSKGRDKDWRSEPVEAWRRLAREAALMLRATAALKTATAEFGPGDRADLEALALPNDVAELVSDKNERLQEALRRAVNMWLDMGAVCLRLQWDHLGPRAYIDTGGPRSILGFRLFGTLAVQLMLLAHGGEAIAICDGCGELFTPYRQPSQRRHAYCENCKHVRQRDYKRRVRAEEARGPATVRKKK